jgi:hypothetical protein
MTERPYGLVAVFDSPAAITHACERLRDAGYRRFDAHTPFPVHGLERAMGLRPTRLPYLVLACAIVGGSGALGLQSWVHSFGYAQNIAGKPFFALPAYVPVTFEITILLSAFGAFFGVWGLSRLPQLFHPVMRHPSFVRASDDRFLVSVEAADAKFDRAATEALLRDCGGTEVEEVRS